MFATLLRIEDAPAIDLTLEGSGPLDGVDVTSRSTPTGTRVADGLIALRSSDAGLGFDVDFTRRRSRRWCRPDFRDFFAGESAVRVSGVSKAGGGLRIADARRRRRGAAASRATSRPAPTASCAT